MRITIPVSPGELLDKISILEIKSEKIKNHQKLKNVNCEKALLDHQRLLHIPPSQAIDQAYCELKTLNEKLWNVEDELRFCEAKGCFNQTFIELARSVYLTNDQRAEVKRRINEILGSDLMEEKYFTSLEHR